MTVGQAQIQYVTQQVWSTVLGMAIEPVQASSFPANGFVVGKVGISGAWQGVVSVGCSTDLARRAAGAMFSLAPSDATAGEINDAVGELTNIIGGNIKTFLKGDCRLSLPAVAAEVELSDADDASSILQEIWFASEGGLVLVRVTRT